MEENASLGRNQFLKSSRDIEVIFIRHAETEENIKVNALFEVFRGLQELRLPSIHQIWQCLQLVAYNEENSHLSRKGQQQLVDMQNTLIRTQFWEKNPFDVCYFSPYMRTKQTCFSLLPPDHHPKCQSLDLLKEIPFYAHLSRQLIHRTEKFQSFLAHSPHNKIVLVGHCKYFQTLLHMTDFMWNTDIWKATLHISPLNPQGKWSVPTLLVRSPFSTPHPAGGLLRRWPFNRHILRETAQEGSREQMSSSNKRSGERGETNPPSNTEEEEEIICRICQATPEEDSSSPFISPCLCTGSLRYVHLNCLQTWRAQSNNPEAYERCSTCRYVYRIRRTAMGRALTNPLWIGVAVVLLMIFGALLVGALLSFLPYIESGKDLYEKLLKTVNCHDKGGIRCLLLSRSSARLHPPHNPYVHDNKFTWLYTLHLAPLLLSLYCHPIWGVGCKWLLTGALGLGLAGQGYYYLSLLRLIGGGDGRQAMGAVGMTFVWFQGGDIRGTVRLWGSFGLIYLGSRLLGEGKQWGKELAQKYFGDDILEVER